MKKPTSVLVYDGPSQLNHAPIVAVATNLRRASKNPKTGNAVQVWILARDPHPVDAMHWGADAAVCGDCQLRGRVAYTRNRRGRFTGVQFHRACYVNPMSVISVWRKYQRGATPYVNLDEWQDLVAGRVVRLGAYGDPAALPLEVVEGLVKPATRHTGYTHQWKTCNPAFQRTLMASVDTHAERQDAAALGWRTFRIKTTEVVVKGEIACPASAEAGHRTTCVNCTLCDGARPADRRANIAILPHGYGRKWIPVEVK